MSLVRAIGRRLERIGGIVVSPRRTLSRFLAEERGGGLSDLLFVALPGLVAVSPVEVGRALLLSRQSLLDALQLLLSALAGRFGPSLLGAVVAALLLEAALRLSKKPSAGFERTVDACFLLLIPHVLLAVLGAAASELGLELWFMPHRQLRGGASVLAIRFLVAYGWSLGLFALLVQARRQAKVRHDSDGEAGSA